MGRRPILRPVQLGGRELQREVGRVTSIVASHAGLQGDLHGDDLSKLTFLSNLDLSFNRLVGHLPVLPTPLQFLRTIDLGSNSFRIPEGFFPGLPALETIVLDNNHLTTAWIEQTGVTSCSRLRSFSANNASIFDGFPNFLGNVTLFPALERLSLARNRLWGSIHPEFGANSKIRYFDIGGQNVDRDYKIDGRMDLFIPGMVNLVEAHLDHNGFSGSLPDATQLVNLRVFDASYNDLCGVTQFPVGTLVDLTGNPRVGGGCSSTVV